jgi:hypothetical protein
MMNGNLLLGYFRVVYQLMTFHSVPWDRVGERHGRKSSCTKILSLQLLWETEEDHLRHSDRENAVLETHSTIIETACWSSCCNLCLIRYHEQFFFYFTSKQWTQRHHRMTLHKIYMMLKYTWCTYFSQWPSNIACSWQLPHSLIMFPATWTLHLIFVWYGVHTEEYFCAMYWQYIRLILHKFVYPRAARFECWPGRWLS